MPRAFTLALLLLLTAALVACGGDEAGPTETAPTAMPIASPAPSATPMPPSATAAPTDAPVETAPAAATATPMETAATPTAVMPEPTAAPAQAGSVSLAPVVTGLGRLTYLTHAGDERLFITEKEGRILVVAGGAVQPAPFLDIRDRVGTRANEQGLLSVAFHPDYASNGYFYVNYTDRRGDTVIARYEVDADAQQASAASEQVLLNIAQPYGNHNGGQLQFGPDGYLYVGMGDGGSGGDPLNNGQNPSTLLGTLLRLDVNAGGEAGYAIPPDNPYVGDDNGGDEIWAIGLRNPWRFSFDRATGDLYVADVGQNAYEEVNFVPAGAAAPANFGWNIMEGLHCFRGGDCASDGLTLPVIEYSHPEGGCSVTGGYVYRGAASPALAGNYFYGDYCSGLIWSVLPGAWQPQVVATSPENIASFGEDASGELYVVTDQGSVYRMQP